ncbi:MAG TPA: FlgD immunoglobulin-like domain containing protein, partial [Candidatus Eisenbacteria bacterium]|nr:FlgD immunoglobulin-like domain containing protein [Candidatus Eisenbacteria bacterium]
PLSAGPLPFRGGDMHITFASDGGSLMTELAIYDIQGRRIRTLVRGHYPVGESRVTWDGRDEAGQHTGSGAYFLRLSDGGRTVATSKILVAR